MIAIIVAGGEPVHPHGLPAADLVVAADSGLELASLLGLEVDVVIGDMDSVDPQLLAGAGDQGVTIERHSPDKDATDLELALELALARGARRVIVAGGAGGRLDHLLANAQILASDRWSDVLLEWWTGDARATVVRSEAVIEGSPDDVVSLLPVAGPVSGISTTGLRWALQGEDLAAGSARGVSNRLLEHSATVGLESGVLLVIQQAGEG